MKEWLYDALAIFVILYVLSYLFSPKFRHSDIWKATVTPLASIIGSGFLVSAPLLHHITGPWATLTMCIIVVIAYGIGSSIRYNIQNIEPLLSKHDDSDYWILKLEALSKPTLGIAYLISVCFYLKLLSAFAFQGFHIHQVVLEKSLTTMILLFIGLFGLFKGLKLLELLETYSVNIKLAIICALSSCFVLYNFQLLSIGEWHFGVEPNETIWRGFRQVLGMLIIVQGFETSRYLGEAYQAETRIKTMRYAQYISSIIYVVFVAISSAIFKQITTVSETTIIDLSRIVTNMLPFLLVFAAILSQFSAAISDTLGGGGLLSEAMKSKLSSNFCYLIIASLAIVLTWITNIYEIITIASRAFSLYYAIQLTISLRHLSIRKSKVKAEVSYQFIYGVLLIIMLMVLILGIPME